MSDKIETKPFNARIKVEDHKHVTNFLSHYEVKHEGFSEFVKQAMANSQTLPADLSNNEIFDKIKFEQLSPEQQNTFLETIFANDFYKNFINEEQPNHALFAIIEGMRFANQKKFETNAIEPTPGETQTDETTFVEEDLKEKVNLLHRHLRTKNKIPAETTQGEYLKELLKYSLRYFLLNEYPEIYNRK